MQSTDRLLLREPTMKDLEDFHEILSNPNVNQFSELPKNPSLKDTKQFLKWMTGLNTLETGRAWVLCLQNKSEVIGSVRIYKIDRKAHCALLAFELNPHYWNQGYITEALSHVLNFAHVELKLNRLEAWASEDNIASDRVLQKNNFQLEGLLREKVSLHGKLENIRLYSHLASD